MLVHLEPFKPSASLTPRSRHISENPSNNAVEVGECVLKDVNIDKARRLDTTSMCASGFMVNTI